MRRSNVYRVRSCGLDEERSDVVVSAGVQGVVMLVVLVTAVVLDEGRSVMGVSADA